MYQGYCMHCKAKRPIKDRYAYKTKKNKYMVKGECNKCGGKICHMISKNDYERENSFEQQQPI